MMMVAQDPTAGMTVVAQDPTAGMTVVAQDPTAGMMVVAQDPTAGMMVVAERRRPCAFAGPWQWPAGGGTHLHALSRLPCC
jgi:hypothetical protein